MDYSIETLALDKQQTDCVIVGLYENKLLTPSAIAIDELNKIKSEDTTELDLLKEHHKLLVELIMNFYR